MAKKKKNKKWIQKAIKNPGALKKQAEKEDAVTKAGKIKKKWLKKMAEKGNTKTAKRARLALTLEKLRKKKK